MNLEIPKIKAPIDENGKFHEYLRHPEKFTRDNFSFVDTMHIGEVGRYGRSSVAFILTSKTTGTTYGMFLVEFNRLLDMTPIINREVTGEWTFCKRGQNYSIRFLNTQESLLQLMVSNPLP